MMARTILLADCIEFLQQFLLPCSQVNWCFHRNMAKQITSGLIAYSGNSFAAQTEDFSSLGTGRNLDPGMAIKCRHLDFTTQSGDSKTDWYFAMQMITFSLENLVAGKMNDDIQITCLSAIDTRFPFSRQPDAITFIHASRNSD